MYSLSLNLTFEEIKMHVYFSCSSSDVFVHDRSVSKLN